MHIHTTYSDGSVDLETIVHQAFLKGYNYIVITDHSYHIPLLNGLNKEKLLNQIEKIDKLN